MKNFVTAATIFVMQVLSIQVIYKCLYQLSTIMNNFLYLRACDEFDYTIIKSSRLMTIVVLTCLPCTGINNILYVVWCSQ